MGKVNVLSEEVAHLIAAGEVVQRPVSVIKELVENAIDAGSSRVTVEIKGGGVTFMKVSDNGSGILREDVPACLQRHATSKIKDKDDLDGIATLGFRGEALAAISSVSRLSIITCAEEEQVGTHAQFEGGRQQELEDTGCPVGTTMIVRDLFFNTPARMKFLKKDSTEAGHIGDMMEHLALSHPQVSFRFLRDGRTVLNTSGNGKVADAIYNIYGRDFYQSLIPVNYTYQSMRLWGYVSKPIYARSSRSMQNFFVNGRYVKNKNLMFGLEEAYHDCIMSKKYPACVLYLEMEPTSYDVNVHPEKTEVKFAREKDIYDLMFYGCKSALTADDVHVSGEKAIKKQAAYVETQEGPAVVQVERLSQASPQQKEDESQQMLEFLASFREKTKVYRNDYTGERPQTEPVRELHSPSWSDYAPKKVETPRQPCLDVDYEPLPGREPKKKTVPASLVMPVPPVAEPVQQSEQREEAQTNEQRQKVEKVENLSVEEVSQESVMQQETLPSTQTMPYRIVGEVLETYIVVEQGESVLLIDKHAAHERILYEQLKEQSRERAGQLLLEPVVETFSRGEVALLTEHREVFEHLGFQVEDFGENAVMIRQIPMGFEKQDIRTLVGEILTHLQDNRSRVALELEDELLHTMACKAAIKAHQKNSEMEIDALIQRLMQGDIKYCPHGRPVCIELTKYTIERQFGRIV